MCRFTAIGGRTIAHSRARVHGGQPVCVLLVALKRRRRRRRRGAPLSFASRTVGCLIPASRPTCSTAGQRRACGSSRCRRSDGTTGTTLLPTAALLPPGLRPETCGLAANAAARSCVRWSQASPTSSSQPGRLHERRPWNNAAGAQTHLTHLRRCTQGRTCARGGAQLLRRR